MSLSELDLWREVETALDEITQLLHYQHTRAALEDWEPAFLPGLVEAIILVSWAVQRIRDSHLDDAEASLALAEAQLQDLKEGI